MKKQIHFIGLAIVAPMSMTFAQTPATPPRLPGAPVQAQRIPAAPSLPQSLLLQKYDFGDQLRVLENPTAMASQKPPAPPPPNAAPGPTTTAANQVPKDYQPRTDVPLSPTALEAVRVSETWR